MKFISLNQCPVFLDDFFMRSLDKLKGKDALVIYNPPSTLITSPVLLRSKKTLEEHIAYLRDNNIKKAIVVAENIQFLSQCPGLEYLWVLPGMDSVDFDYSPVYTMPNLKWLSCRTTAGLDDRQVASVDYSQFKGLRRLCVSGAQGHENVNLAGNVVSLIFDQGFPKAKDLKNYIPGKELRNFSICASPITSLHGIEQAMKLRYLSLSYNRRLTDISSLSSLRDTLARIEIDACGRIESFSVLETLTNLEFLALKGSNTLPNLSFLKYMPKLKYLYLTMNVADGDLSLCQSIPYVRIQNRKHYSHKNQDLPKQITDPDAVYSLEEM